MQVQPADIAERRRVARILACVAVVLAILAVAFEFWLRSLSSQLDGPGLLAALKPVLRVCLLSIAACGLGLGAYLFVRGNTIVRERRFPAGDTRVIRATPIREGPHAVRIGRHCQAGGVLLFVAGGVFAVLAMLWVNGLG
ncbi:MAG: hypothetical protein P4L92_22595 [Rudaea sp.]|nr:hypothetical protein [Rudaea sp.]